MKNGDWFQIDSYCVPKQFNTSETPISSETCPEYPHKYQSSELEIGEFSVNKRYIEFPDDIKTNIENYVNQSSVGLVKAWPLEQIYVGLTRLMTSGNEQVPDLIMYWDEYVYHATGVSWDPDNSAKEVRFDISRTDQVTTSLECDHESYYKIYIKNTGDFTPALVSPIVIKEIHFGDTRSDWSIETFCIDELLDTNLVYGSQTLNGDCSDRGFAGVTEWNRVCVGDGFNNDLNAPDRNNCSNSFIEILLPDNLYKFGAGIGNTKGLVIDSDLITNAALTCSPTNIPTSSPTTDPSNDPTHDPTSDPSNDPTGDPTMDPTNNPTTDPTKDPTANPTEIPTDDPTTTDPPAL